MRKAKSLFHSANHAINYCARSIAKNAVKEQLRAQGVRLTLVPIREINERAQQYLANHPELYQQALEHARKMGWVDLQPPMVTPDPAPELPKKRKRRPVTGSAKSATDFAEVFSTTSTIFRGSSLLITY
jgi:hypothetical protein